MSTPSDPMNDPLLSDERLRTPIPYQMGNGNFHTRHLDPKEVRDIYEADRRSLLDRIASLEEDRRWIPVEEKLPEPLDYNPGRSDDVVVWLGKNHARFVTFYQYSTGHWHFQNGGEAITHWQPLPEGPTNPTDSNG